jgi:hypothetical protein
MIIIIIIIIIALVYFVNTNGQVIKNNLLKYFKISI